MNIHFLFTTSECTFLIPHNVLFFCQIGSLQLNRRFSAQTTQNDTRIKQCTPSRDTISRRKKRHPSSSKRRNAPESEKRKLREKSSKPPRSPRISTRAPKRATQKYEPKTKVLVLDLDETLIHTTPVERMFKTFC